MKGKERLLPLVCILALAALTPAWATSRVSNVTTGNWNTAGTWTPAAVPVAGDSVTIKAGHTITVDVQANCGALYIYGTLTGNSFYLNVVGSGTSSPVTSGDIYVKYTAPSTYGSYSGAGILYSNSGAMPRDLVIEQGCSYTDNSSPNAYSYVARNFTNAGTFTISGTNHHHYFNYVTPSTGTSTNSGTFTRTSTSAILFWGGFTNTSTGIFNSGPGSQWVTVGDPSNVKDFVNDGIFNWNNVNNLNVYGNLTNNLTFNQTGGAVLVQSPSKTLLNASTGTYTRSIGISTTSNVYLNAINTLFQNDGNFQNTSYGHVYLNQVGASMVNNGTYYSVGTGSYTCGQIIPLGNQNVIGQQQNDFTNNYGATFTGWFVSSGNMLRHLYNYGTLRDTRSNGDGAWFYVGGDFVNGNGTNPASFTIDMANHMSLGSTFFPWTGSFWNKANATFTRGADILMGSAAMTIWGNFTNDGTFINNGSNYTQFRGNFVNSASGVYQNNGFASSWGEQNYYGDFTNNQPDTSLFRLGLCSALFYGGVSPYPTDVTINGVPTRFYNLYWRKWVNPSNVTCNIDLWVRNGLIGDQYGSFILGPHTLTLGDPYPGYAIAYTNAKLFLTGTDATHRALVRAITSVLPFYITNYGYMEARYATFFGMTGNGIFNYGGTLGPAPNNLSDCIFNRLGGQGAALRLEDATDQTLTNVDFSGTKVPPLAFNVQKNFSSAGRITVLSGWGTQWGEAYEDDAFGLIDWAPAPFIQVAPAHNATGVAQVNVAFDWNDAVGTGAVTYALYLDKTDANFPGGGFTPIATGLTSSQYMYAGPLDLGQVYYWRVKATNATGTRWSGSGPSSGNFKFTTTPMPAPTAFNLLTPANHAAEQALSGSLTWQAATGASNYDVYLGTTTPPALYKEDAGNVTTYPYVVTEHSTLYHWAVVAKNAGGEVRCNADFDFTSAELPHGWNEARSMPKTPTTEKAPKDGAWLAVHSGADADPVLYVAKGNKSTDFYKFDPAEGDSGTWHADIKQIPANEGTKTKLPSKGCVGVSDGTKYLYMTKGNNTLGFWRYDIAGNKWDSMAGVPEGQYGKRVKGGTDMVFAKYRDTGCVYLLKGYKTEFYRYNPLTARWFTLKEVPYGLNKQKYDKGSFLGYDETNKLIYAHQAKYYDKTAEYPHHYMFKYDVAADSWYKAARNGMPVLGLEGGREGKKKKSADGAAGAWAGENMYALKGGNTQGFFKYFPVPDTWVQLDTVPGNGTFGKKKRVKAGGDLAAISENLFFAMKGNKCYEFWKYTVGAGAVAGSTMPRSGVQAGLSSAPHSAFSITPNPIANGFATVRYVLPKAGPVSISVFDVAGRSVLSQAYSAGRKASSVHLDLRKLSAGVYLVRLDADGQTTTQKLVVQR